MKKLELVLCEQDASYINLFATYLMEYDLGLNIHIFTSEEKFFADDNQYDVGILSREFIEMESFKTSGKIGRIYCFTNEIEEEKDFEYPQIYKFQSMDEIISQVKELGLAKVKSEINTTKRSKEHCFVTGIYSPISHELQLPFALALAESLKSQGRVLFLDFEENSILHDLCRGSRDNNVMDYIYQLSNSDGQTDVEMYVQHFEGFDYIPSFIGPEEMNDIPASEYIKLFEDVRNRGYDHIVALFGRSISGFSSILRNIDQLILLTRAGDYYSKSTGIFMDYLNAMNIDIPIEVVQLMMSAANLSEGAYCMEELIHGNLGIFIRKLHACGQILTKNSSHG